ncbi:hypothetical protein KAU25_05835 [Candidatus Bathyarchaeota archaeon]|nr:hypothetical protein [Candidatus Bathyarchaeota archaeon]
MKKHSNLRVSSYILIAFSILIICFATLTGSVQSFLQYPIITANPTKTIIGHQAVVNATIAVSPG